MSDLVERLRAEYDPSGLVYDAADEIERLRSLADDMGLTNIESQKEIERLRALSQNNARSWDVIVRERDDLRAEVERLRAREAQAKTIIRAAAVYVSHVGGWQATWHRDADKWVGVEHAGSKTSC